MSDPYVYPDSIVLRNKLGITDADELEWAEKTLVAQRVREGCPAGKFDLDHLRAIHRHLFQDLYEWAGEIRTVEINKGSSQFQFRQYIQTGMADVHVRLMKAKYLRGLSAEAFSRRAGAIMGDVNYVHPFREGNGRTQLQYLKQLATQAGHLLDLTKLEREKWLNASREAHQGRYDLMAACVRSCIAVRERATHRDTGREM